jgi:peroxiredoxin
MKTKIIQILIIIFCVTLSCNSEKKDLGEGYIVRTGDIAPDFQINEPGGKSYKLSDLRGKIVMLQFTASWCSVCREEMPFIESEIWQPGKDSGLVVIGIDRAEPPEVVSGFRNEIGVTYPIALDPEADIFGLFAIKEAGVTRNVIIDRNGKIIFLTRLFDRAEFNEMKKTISRALDAK